MQLVSRSEKNLEVVLHLGSFEPLGDGMGDLLGDLGGDEESGPVPGRGAALIIPLLLPLGEAPPLGVIERPMLRGDFGGAFGLAEVEMP